MKMKLCAAGLGLLLAGCDVDSTNPANVERDNTAVNQRDVNDPSLTPMDQSNASADINQVAAIRAAVLEINDLSVNGRNVKIITDAGKVVLRGPVATEAERVEIGKVAERIAGAGNVSNMLEVTNR